MKSHMNSQHPRITFTTKEEQNRSLLFMDVCFNRREDGKLMRQVYQKPTHTNRYVMFGSYHPMDVMDVMFWSYHPMDVMFGSYHPMAVKEGIVQGLAVTAMKVSSDEATRAEEFNIHMSSHRTVIRKILSRKLSASRSGEGLWIRQYQREKPRTTMRCKRSEYLL